MGPSLAALLVGNLGRLTTTIYTDGACSGNPGPGGWAWAVGPRGRRRTGPAARPARPTSGWRSWRCWRRCGPTTATLTIVSDSTYVVNCFRDKLVGEVAARTGGRTRRSSRSPTRTCGSRSSSSSSGAQAEVPLGQGPLRRQDERPRRPARRRRRRRRPHQSARPPRRVPARTTWCARKRSSTSDAPLPRRRLDARRSGAPHCVVRHLTHHFAFDRLCHRAVLLSAA